MLAALEELGGINSKQRTIDHIRRKQYFAFSEEDDEPYPGNERSGEPRWITLLAFARSFCVEQSWMSGRGERDSWAITDKGQAILARLHERFAGGHSDVGRFFLGSPAFKKYMHPAYEQSSNDKKRPSDMYADKPPDLSDII